MTARTYKTRKRRLSPSRHAAWTSGLPNWGLDPAGEPLDLTAEFGPDIHRFVLDVGVGGGESTLHACRAEPATGFIAVEVHTPGIARILEEIATAGRRNVRVVEGDVLVVLDRLPRCSLDEVRIFFPDPWPKQRHRHRRLVRPDVVDRLVERLRRGGTAHFATDDLDYADQMRTVLDGHPRLHGGEIARPPWRPLTRYEERAIRAGRRVVDLCYAAVDAPVTR